MIWHAHCWTYCSSSYQNDLLINFLCNVSTDVQYIPDRAAACLVAITDIYLCFPACKAIVDELNHSISQVDPKKTITVGGFRLNPDGTMKDKKVQYTDVSPSHSSVCYNAESLFGYCLFIEDWSTVPLVESNTRTARIRFIPKTANG